MPIARGAGTEIIRCASFQDTDGDQDLIIGVQYHIYTVLNITIQCQALNATTDNFRIFLKGWDAHNGTSAVEHYIVNENMQVGDTYVFSEKFSMNGYEPDSSAMSGIMNTAAEQDAIADQGGSTAQYLRFGCDAATDNYDVHVTFIDQNNA